MADRRRINGPVGGTRPPTFAVQLKKDGARALERPTRSRGQDEMRKMFLKTGVTPTASGSAYLELESPPKPADSFLAPSSALKLTCTVHGPRPLPRSAAFSPSLVLSTHVKFAPFSTRHRRGYVRDSTERDLGAHLETALRGVIIGERWPKTGLDISITILEGEEDKWWGDEPSGGATGVGQTGGWGMMTVLAGCITAASAALVDAGIDCLELIAGGTAAMIRNPDPKEKGEESSGVIVLDPNPVEHPDMVAACVVGYLAQRDEIPMIWLKGKLSQEQTIALVDAAVSAATAGKAVLVDTLTATAGEKFESKML